MSWKWSSLIALAALVGCLLWLIRAEALFGNGPVTIALQVGAASLMIWARATFGRRSFHAAATPTEGGVVTSGPYRHWRHPIYAAVIYFLCAGLAAHWSAVNLAVTVLASLLLGVRMAAEEKLMAQRYPEYAEYARRTARIVPFLF